MADFIDTENYEFDFGQYYGYSYKEILKIDPHYIHWCYHTLGDFDLDELAVTELEERLRSE